MEIGEVGQGHGEKSTLEMGTKGNKLAELLWHLLFWFIFDKLTCSLFAVRAEPHYGWAYVVGDSSQLLSIKPRERPPGGYPALDFGSLSPSVDEPPDEFSPISCGSKNFVCVYAYFCTLNNSNQIPLLLS
ncbi:hypothetical protein DVH24_001826 [Malus domestica]|uniref:Uncharacterized protein n=1 Tax=Malus domestica TaxID=3750 RepID=A0A498I3D7_MALDO|nr:hypothetical protein DVH24_001826 [Malus domestica]